MPISAILIGSPEAEAEPAAVSGETLEAGGDDLALQAPRSRLATTAADASTRRSRLAGIAGPIITLARSSEGRGPRRDGGQR
jgi:hypothetical protein